MPKYPKVNYDEFVAKAQRCHSGLGTRWHFDGALKSLGKLLRKDSHVVEIVQAIGALARHRDTVNINKLRKYRAAIGYLESTFPVPQGDRQAPIEGRSIEAIRFVMSTTPPTVTFGAEAGYVATFKMTQSASKLGLNMTVPQYMTANAVNTRVVLIHLGTPQECMNLPFDGVSSLEHMNAVLRTASDNGIHVCILCDPHTRGIGVGTPSAVNAVCAGLRDAVGTIPIAKIKVVDGGNRHSAFNDPTFRDWVTAAGVSAIVVLGYQADICVRGNVFGTPEELVGRAPREIVPALINIKDVITSRPLLWSDGGTIGAFGEWGMQMCGPHESR